MIDTTRFAYVATLSGSKAHLSDRTTTGNVTLCGREVSNATDASDLCKPCANKAAKLTPTPEPLAVLVVAEPAPFAHGPYLYPACGTMDGDVCEGCGAVKGQDRCMGYPEVDNRPAEVKALLSGESVTVAEGVTLTAAPEGDDTTLTVRVGETVIAQTLTAYMPLDKAVLWAQRELTGWQDTRTDAEKLTAFLADSRALALADYSATTDPAARKLAARAMIDNEGSAPCVDRACTGTLIPLDGGLRECNRCGLTPWGDVEGPVYSRYLTALDAEMNIMWSRAHQDAPCEAKGFEQCDRCDRAHEMQATIDRASILRAAQDNERIDGEIRRREAREQAELDAARISAFLAAHNPTECSHCAPAARPVRRQPRRTTRAQRRRSTRR